MEISLELGGIHIHAHRGFDKELGYFGDGILRNKHQVSGPKVRILGQIALL
jgi:hypothetical protein